jgi:YVTN family beta-propeller protein
MRWGSVAKLVIGSVLVAVLISGCGLGSETGREQAEEDTTVSLPEGKSLVYVFNNGDDTVSVIDTSTDEVIENIETEAKSTFPSNQYAPNCGYILAESPAGKFGLGSGQVDIFSMEENRVVAEVDTGKSTSIWTEVTPDCGTGIIVAQDPDVIYFVNLDDSAGEFGEVIFKEAQPNNPGICDVSLSPDGRYAYIPDVNADTIRVVDIEAQEVAAVVDSPEPAPYMGTVTWDGKYFLVENSGEPGSETIWDISDPIRPKPTVTLSVDDGLGDGPYTDEVTPDSKYSFVINRNSNTVSVIDLESLEVVKDIEMPGSGLVAGAFNEDGSKLYVNMTEDNAVAVIDVEKQEVIGTIDVGAEPGGLVANQYDWIEPESAWSISGVVGVSN